MARPVMGFIGIGKVGETLARLAYANGYTIGAVYNRTIDKANTLATDIDTVVVYQVTDVLGLCDWIILSVFDDVIPVFAQKLSKVDWTGKAIVHVSGSMSLDVLQAVKEAGGMVGSLHPAFPFSDVESSIKAIYGSSFAIEYSDPVLRTWLLDFLNVVDGQVLEIPAGKKAQYHLALAIASNYMVTLYAVAQGLLHDFSEDNLAIKTALDRLMSATMQNLVQQGTPSALTGPLVRADIKTIQSHLQTMDENTILRETYINLAKLSYPMLIERDIDIEQINSLFKENLDASDDT